MHFGKPLLGSVLHDVRRRVVMPGLRRTVEVSLPRRPGVGWLLDGQAEGDQNDEFLWGDQS